MNYTYFILFQFSGGRRELVYSLGQLVACIRAPETAKLIVWHQKMKHIETHVGRTRDKKNKRYPYI